MSKAIQLSLDAQGLDPISGDLAEILPRNCPFVFAAEDGQIPEELQWHFFGLGTESNVQSEVVEQHSSLLKTNLQIPIVLGY